ncbi:MAG: terminase family protein [Nitrososphaerota archaeon]
MSIKKSKPNKNIIDKSEYTPQQIQEILYNCKKDFNYYLNFVKLPVGVTYKKFSDLVYPKQLELIQTCVDKHDVIVLKSRQIGISTIVQAYCSWLLLFYSNYNIGVISRKMEMASKFAKDVAAFIDGFPLALTNSKTQQDRYLKRTETMFTLMNNSSLVCETVSKDNPESVLRGRTLQALVIDEAAFIPKIERAYAGILPTLSTGQKFAKEQNIPYSTIILSTPNGVTGTGEWFYKMWIGAVKGENGYTPVTIHYKDAPFADETWINQIRSKTDPLTWEQEYELKFITGEDSLFDIDTLTKIEQNLKEPIVEKKSYVFNDSLFIAPINYYVNDKEELEDFSYFLIGVDIASALGGQSNSAIVVIGYKENKFSQVMDILCKLPISRLKDVILYIINDVLSFTENKLLIVENNSYGQLLMEELSESDINRFLYYTKTDKKTLPGINTNTKTKELIYDSIYWFVSTYPESIKSKLIYYDLQQVKKGVKKLTDIIMALGFISYVVLNDKEVVSQIQLISNHQELSLFNTIVESNYTEEEVMLKEILGDRFEEILRLQNRYLNTDDDFFK